MTTHPELLLMSIHGEIKMLRTTTTFVLGACIFFLSACDTRGDEPKLTLPNRSDCLVRFSLMNEGGGANSETLNREIAQRLLHSEHKRIIGSIAYGEANTESYYIQFNDLCPRRISLTKDILDTWKRENLITDFEIDPGKVKPGPSTLDAKGPAWRD